MNYDIVYKFKSNKYFPLHIPEHENKYKQKVDNLVIDKFNDSPKNLEAVKNRFLRRNCNYKNQIFSKK